ncbi:MAG: hypothetical protein GX613_12595 [Chloroflexi bacterium]|nr:hypothetical protein [Chloroflexota bacterium]
MASQKNEQSSADRRNKARLADEWANVGLCGGMFRPVRKVGVGVEIAAERRLADLSDNHAPRNQRCCP